MTVPDSRAVRTSASHSLMLCSISFSFFMLLRVL